MLSEPLGFVSEWLALPILHREIRNADELGGVVGDEHCPQAQGLGGQHQIVDHDSGRGSDSIGGKSGQEP